MKRVSYVHVCGYEIREIHAQPVDWNKERRRKVLILYQMSASFQSIIRILVTRLSLFLNLTIEL